MSSADRDSLPLRIGVIATEPRSERVRPAADEFPADLSGEELSEAARSLVAARASRSRAVAASESIDARMSVSVSISISAVVSIAAMPAYAVAAAACHGAVATAASDSAARERAAARELSCSPSGRFEFSHFEFSRSIHRFSCTSCAARRSKRALGGSADSLANVAGGCP